METNLQNKGSNAVQRVFGELMERVGANGKYQRNLLILWCLMTVTVSSTFFSNPFFLQLPEFVCPGLQDNLCKEYVCALPQEERNQFISKPIYSMATHYGDYQCEKNDELLQFQSFIYLGGLIGVFLGSFLSEFLRKKQLLILTLVSSISFYLLTLFAPSLLLGSAGLFGNYAMRGIQMQLIFCFLSQTVSEGERNKQTTMALIFYGIGVTMNGPIFWLLGSWKTVIMLYYLIPNIVFLFLVVFGVQETPFQCVVQCSPTQSLRVFTRIAEINGTSQTHNITIQQIALIKKEYLDNQQSKHDYKVSMLDLFVYPSLRTKSIVCGLLYMLMQFTFDGPQLVLKDSYMSIYLSGFILGSSEIISCVICYFLIDKCKRRTLIFVSTAFALIVAVPIAIFANCSQECNELQQIIQTSGLFVFRLMMSIGFSVALIVQLQLFPTQVRTLGAMMVAASGFIGTISIPYISDALQDRNISVITSFCVACIIVLVLTIFLPESHNIPAPDVIEQLEFHHQNTNRNNSVKQIQQ